MSVRFFGKSIACVEAPERAESGFLPMSFLPNTLGDILLTVSFSEASDEAEEDALLIAAKREGEEEKEEEEDDEDVCPTPLECEEAPAECAEDALPLPLE
mmetsp:Transcript_22481/g.52435  ORF Transcript_22481/g.52435 Transcript_22481/m.52435 type:complete len:100 (+) Transcript_22481:921-1220(+)